MLVNFWEKIFCRWNNINPFKEGKESIDGIAKTIFKNRNTGEVIYEVEEKMFPIQNNGIWINYQKARMKECCSNNYEINLQFTSLDTYSKTAKEDFLSFTKMTMDIISNNDAFRVDKSINIVKWNGENVFDTKYGKLTLGDLLDINNLTINLSIFQFYSDLQVYFAINFSYKIPIETIIVDGFNFLLKDFN